MHITHATFTGLMQGGAQMFVLGAKIMAPAGVALIFSHVAMGILAKIVPQIPIMILSMPLNIAIGFVFLGLSLRFFLPVMVKSFDAFGRDLFRLAMGWGGKQWRKRRVARKKPKTRLPDASRRPGARGMWRGASSCRPPAVLLASLLTLYGMSGFIMERTYAIMRHYLGNLHTMRLVPENMTAFARDGMALAAHARAAGDGAVVAVALLSNLAQFGFLFTTEKLAPKLERSTR